MDTPKGTSRRNFIKLATAGTLMASASGNVFGSVTTRVIDVQEKQTPPFSPNDRIRIATIGVGGQGTADTNAALRRTGAATETSGLPSQGPGVELVAVA